MERRRKTIYDGRPCVPPSFHSIQKNLLENMLYSPKWFLASFHSNSVIVVEYLYCTYIAASQ